MLRSSVRQEVRSLVLDILTTKCLQGGATHFERLNISVKPKCGKALLFFPAFKDGNPDPRCAFSSHHSQFLTSMTLGFTACGTLLRD